MSYWSGGTTSASRARKIWSIHKGIYPCAFKVIVRVAYQQCVAIGYRPPIAQVNHSDRSYLFCIYNTRTLKVYKHSVSEIRLAICSIVMGITGFGSKISLLRCFPQVARNSVSLLHLTVIVDQRCRCWRLAWRDSIFRGSFSDYWLWEFVMWDASLL